MQRQAEMKREREREREGKSERNANKTRKIIYIIVMSLIIFSLLNVVIIFSVQELVWADRRVPTISLYPTNYLLLLTGYMYIQRK